MATFINPFVDRGFKHLFGQEDSKELLIDLLNGLFEGERLITELSFLNVEMPAESTDGRAAVFDLKCKDKDGRIFIVEVQNATQMKAQGLDVVTIMSVTGLDAATIDSL